MIKYTVDVLDRLNQQGYTTYKLRKDKIMGERTIQQLRHGQLVSWLTLDTICKLLHCQPGDILQYVEDRQGEEGKEV